jgi:hypothetical protein
MLVEQAQADLLLLREPSIERALQYSNNYKLDFNLAWRIIKLSLKIYIILTFPSF